MTIGIYDVQGQRIRRLQLGQLTAGRYVTADQAAYGDGMTEVGSGGQSSGNPSGKCAYLRYPYPFNAYIALFPAVGGNTCKSLYGCSGKQRCSSG